MLGFLDENFVRWTGLLLDDDAPWTSVAPLCPNHALFKCCPQIRRLGQEDPVLLADLSPGHALAYAILRRTAETIAQWAVCWLLPASAILAILVFLTMNWNTELGDVRRKNSGGKRCKSRVFLLLLLCVLPLSVALHVCLHAWLLKAENQIHNVYFDSFLRTNKALLMKMSSWKRRPSLLDLLSPSALHRILFPDLDRDGPCLAASLCLSWWAVILFTVCLYGSSAMMFEMILGHPIKNLYMRLSGDPECRKRSMDPRSRTCALDFTTDCLDALGGSGQEVKNYIEFGHRPGPTVSEKSPSPVAPRFITRATPPMTQDHDSPYYSCSCCCSSSEE